MTWRVFWFLIRLGALGTLAVFFSSEPGRVSIDWRGWAIDMPVGVAVLAVFLLALLLLCGERTRQTLFRFPGRWRAHRKAIREMKGYRALTLGMVAVAAGDRDAARRQARRARDLLSEAPLTMLLQAQSAQLNGDDKAACAYFEIMRGDPEVAFLGLRGLIAQTLQTGDKARALDLAEEARRLRPTARWVLLELLDLQIGAGKWGRALTTLDEAERTGALSAEDAQPIRVRLAVRRAHALSDEGKTEEALKLAQTAARADPDNTDATALSAELLHRIGKTRKAEKLIEEAWSRKTTPRLAGIYGAMAPDGASALDNVKRFERLLAWAPDAAESHIALARAALDAALWGEARTHLAKATDALGDPPPRLCRLWARLEEVERGDLIKAHAWLVRAADGATAAGADDSPDDPPPMPAPTLARRDGILPV